MKIAVLGGGMVGSAIAKDLQTSYGSVTVADYSNEVLQTLKQAGISTQQADLSDRSKVKAVIADADIVVGAVPGYMGFETARTVIEAGKNYVDISFFPEDPFELQALAKEKGVIAIVDFGVAPGSSNLILGYHYANMKIDEFSCYVGGLPKARTLPWQYKAPFSPIDVIEEYTRPARLMENGKVVTKPALTEPEMLQFEECGTLEAFNTDGLRTVLDTIKVLNMKEKTLRYPGHRSNVEVLRDSGMFSMEETEVNGVKVKPIDLTAKLLFKEWKLGAEEPEFTIMRITVEGTENGVAKTYTYSLYDEYDPTTKTSSMARTTGYTCTAGVTLLIDELVTEAGVYAPEQIGQLAGCFDSVMAHLAERNIKFKVKEA